MKCLFVDLGVLSVIYNESQNGLDTFFSNGVNNSLGCLIFDECLLKNIRISEIENSGKMYKSDARILSLSLFLSLFLSYVSLLCWKYKIPFLEHCHDSTKNILGDINTLFVEDNYYLREAK